MRFFSEIQRWFVESRSSDHAGTYIQKIILEWERNDKAGFRKFISTSLNAPLPSNYRLEQEYYFQEGRRADLAILHGEVPLLLLEIKWNDLLGKETSNKDSQLDDYVSYCLKMKKCCLLVLTKDALSLLEQKSLSKLNDRGHHQYFGHLSTYLKMSSSPIAKLFFEYLQDKGVVMNEIDTHVLYRFFHRFVNPYNGAGIVTNEEQLTGGPEQFINLLNNMRLISQEISPIINDIKGVKQSATVDFFISPRFSRKKMLAELDEAEVDKDVVGLRRSARVGGEIYVFARHRLFNDPWFQLEYGFVFDVVANKEHTFGVRTYSGVCGKGFFPGYEFDKKKAKYLGMLRKIDSKAEFISEMKIRMVEAMQCILDEKLVDVDRKKSLLGLIKKLGT